MHPFCQGTAAKIQSQTKDKLVSSEVRPAVEDVINTELASYLDENPAEAHAICEKSLRLPVREKRLEKLAT